MSDEQRAALVGRAMIDLDALKRDLKEAGYPVEQMTPSLIGFSITAPDRALAWEIHALVWSSGEFDVWATTNIGEKVCVPGAPIAPALAIIAWHVKASQPDRAALAGLAGGRWLTAEEATTAREGLMLAEARCDAIASNPIRRRWEIDRAEWDAERYRALAEKLRG